MVDFVVFFCNVVVSLAYNGVETNMGMKGFDRIEEDYVACRGCQLAS